MRGLKFVFLAGVLAGPAAADETDAVTAASPWATAHGAFSAADKAGHEARMAEWREALNLSPEQQAVMAEIFMDYGARLRPLFERGADTAYSIMKVAPKDPGYSLDTERAAQAAADTAADIVRVMSEMRSAINSIMTAEQIETLEGLIEQQRQKAAEAKAAKAAEEAAQMGGGQAP